MLNILTFAFLASFLFQSTIFAKDTIRKVSVESKVNCQLDLVSDECWKEGEKAFKNNNFDVAGKIFEPRCMSNNPHACHILGVINRLMYNQSGTGSHKVKSVDYFSKACNILKKKDSFACKDLSQMVSCKKNPC